MDVQELTIQAGGADLNVRVPLAFKPLRKVIFALKTVDSAFKGGSITDEALSVMEDVLVTVLQPLNSQVTPDWVADNLSMSDFVDLLGKITELSGLEKKAPTVQAEPVQAEIPIGPPSTES